MDEKNSSSNVAAIQVQSVSQTEKATLEPKKGPVERNEADQRKAYGTAKTENLRDSGAWRILMPTAVAMFCLLLLAIPLFILIPLLSNSIAAMHGGNSQEAQLLWVWIAMIVVELGIAAVVIGGFCRIFMTQAGNYHA